jgi:hypothetical protein
VEAHGTAAKYLVDITERRMRRVKGLTPAAAVSLLSKPPIGSVLPFVEQPLRQDVVSPMNAT